MGVGIDLELFSDNFTHIWTKYQYKDFLPFHYAQGLYRKVFHFKKCLLLQTYLKKNLQFLTSRSPPSPHVPYTLAASHYCKLFCRNLQTEPISYSVDKTDMHLMAFLELRQGTLMHTVSATMLQKLQGQISHKLLAFLVAFLSLAHKKVPFSDSERKTISPSPAHALSPKLFSLHLYFPLWSIDLNAQHPSTLAGSSLSSSSFLQLPASKCHGLSRSPSAMFAIISKMSY